MHVEATEADKLTPEEITGIAPRNLLSAVVRGIKEETSYSIGVMLDVDEPDEDLSLGTGKVLISMPQEAASVACQFVRAHPALKDRCALSDRWAFDMAKKKVMKEPGYTGEAYWCKSLHLRDFVIPIYERKSGSFIGVILGGQRRKPGGIWSTWRDAKKYARANPTLMQHRLRLWNLYRQVPELDEAEFREEMEICRRIARDLAKLFEFYIQQKAALGKHGSDRRKRDHTVAKIQKGLIDAQSFKAFWEFMPEVAESLWLWLAADWCLVLRQKEATKCALASGLEVAGRARSCRGIDRPESVETALTGMGPFGTENDMLTAIAAAAKDFVSEDASCEVFPVSDGDGRLVACLALGSAPKHKNHNTEYSKIHESRARIQEVANTIGMEYREIAASERERLRADQLEIKKGQLDEHVQLLQDALMSLNHQLHGPLLMLTGILTLVRDFVDSVEAHGIREQIDLGIEVADQGAFLCSSLAKVWAHDQGRRVTNHQDTKIDVSKELAALAKAMKKTRDQERREVACRLDESPPIIMDRTDFLYVFYSLFDNTLKYGDPDEPIIVECSWENSVQRYCFKVKSIGHPIGSRDIGRVFEKFWRHEKAWRDDEMGLGVGCWAARECMRRCGGEVYLEVNGALSVFVVVPPEHD